MKKIRTLEQAFEFVMTEKVCTIFGSEGSPFPSLWDNVDLPERKKGEKGWGEKVSAIWTWKNELPATFPDEIFYGKVPGGDAVLMEMEHLGKNHYRSAKQEVASLIPLAQRIFAQIKIEPHYTGELRNAIMEETGCTKSRFDTALKNLQITLNIARSNHPDEKRDRWLPFSELYPDIADNDG